MPGKPDESMLSQDDQEMFREAMQGVRPLKHSRFRPSSPKPVARRLNHPVEQQLHSNQFRDPVHQEDLSAPDQLLFTRPGVQQRMIRKLKKGQLPPEASLDLHGHRIDEARQAVADFLSQASFCGFRVVSIIHGKGMGSAGAQGVLKKMVNFWLPQEKCVLAFCSAQPRDGGSGAVYILIKKIN